LACLHSFSIHFFFQQRKHLHRAVPSRHRAFGDTGG
jgi:hypothetical protein